MARNSDLGAPHNETVIVGEMRNDRVVWEGCGLYDTVHRPKGHWVFHVSGAEQRTPNYWREYQ